MKRRALPRSLLHLSLFASLASTLAACTHAPLPEPVTQAEAVRSSPSAAIAKEHAPQAFAEAEKLRAEAHLLHQEGRLDEAAAAGDQAIAAYSHAFALARQAQAQERVGKAQNELNEAQKKLSSLDLLHSEVAASADAYEMAARVHLDTEEVKDVDSISPERAAARRLAAKRLSAEANLLCIATGLLDEKAEKLEELKSTLSTLDRELSQGSVKDDLFPRAADARSQCLKQLTLARRPNTLASPDSSDSDELLTSLSATKELMVYRDDRGIVVNIGAPLDAQGELLQHATSALNLLGGTSRAHPDFPLLLVIHTSKNGDEKRAEQMTEQAKASLGKAGATNITVKSVFNAQPVVQASIRGAAEKNERIEVIFVHKGR